MNSRGQMSLPRPPPQQRRIVGIEAEDHQGRALSFIAHRVRIVLYIKKAPPVGVDGRWSTDLFTCPLCCRRAWREQCVFPISLRRISSSPNVPKLLCFSA